MKVVLEH